MTPLVLRPVYGPLSPFGKGRRGSSCQLAAPSPPPVSARTPSQVSHIRATSTPTRRSAIPSRRLYTPRVDLSMPGVFSPFFTPQDHPTTPLDTPTTNSSPDPQTSDVAPDPRIPSASAGPSALDRGPMASASLSYPARQLLKGWIVVSWLLAGSSGVRWVKKGA